MSEQRPGLGVEDVHDARSPAPDPDARADAHPEPEHEVTGSSGARSNPWSAGGFLLPALVVLGVLMLYPILFSVWRSLYNAAGAQFIGLDNYVRMFTDPSTFTALKNNVIWVVVAPTVVTALGLIFAVLTERIRWATAFKLVVFMPMAISFLAAGVIFRLVYEQDPDRGFANAAITSVHDIFNQSSEYPGARPRDEAALMPGPAGGYVLGAEVGPGESVSLPFVAVQAGTMPEEAQPAGEPQAAAGDALTGVVWEDFAPGGGGEPGVIDEGERGMPGVTVQAVTGDQVVAEATTGQDGTFTISGLDPGSYTVAVPQSNFAEPFRGISWLGPSLVTPSIIAAYVWMWAGFAMVLIAAGLAAIPRDALEAARVDGGTEWQVFRRVTMPLLAPVLMVVFVTLVINVLKIFDLVYIIAPGSSAPEANVLAVQMWTVSFGGGDDQGLGSALGVFLFLLVLPAMLFNIRRFRQEQS